MCRPAPHELIWHDDLQQGSEEWFAARLGKVTGSVASPIAADPSKGHDGLSVGTWSMIYQLAGHLVADENDEPEFGNYWTDRGNEMEPLARAAYEDREWVNVNAVGFVEWSGRLAGCSPDFMVDAKRGGEIKCLGMKSHIAAMENFRKFGIGSLTTDYLRQIQWCLYITGFTYWDMVHFHPKAKLGKLHVFTIERDNKLQDIYAERFPLVEAAIIEVAERYRGDKLKLTQADPMGMAA